MSIENGKDCRNFLHNPEDHMAIKEKRRMLKFKLHVFSTALYQEKRNYKKLIDGTERRKERHKPLYKTREELDQAYIIGALTDREYMRNRSAIWQVYSDRGHIKNIEWLESEVEKYEAALNMLDAWIMAKRIQSQKKYALKRKRKLHKRAYNKHRNRRIRAVQKQERWENMIAERREQERIEMEEIEKIKEEDRRRMEMESEEYFNSYDD